MLIKADHRSHWCWLMYLQAVLDSLTAFGVAGHIFYLPSAHYYWQAMSNLDEIHLYPKFIDGFHFVRRSNQYGTGLSSDLVIEQALVRSLKSTGGLTHGSGITGDMRNLWTHHIRVQQCNAGFHRSNLLQVRNTQRLTHLGLVLKHISLILRKLR